MNLSKRAKKAAQMIDEKFSDCKEDCKNGLISPDMEGLIIQTISEILDNWDPELSYSTKCEVLDWVQWEYGICM